MNFLRFNFFFLFVFVSCLSFGQRGKNNNFTTSVLNTVLNSYSALTVNGNVGSSNLVVANNILIGGGFTNSLEQGDLILIIQMYGAGVPIDWWNGQFGGSTGISGMDQSLWNANGAQFGGIDNYYNCGHFEVREVLSVSG